MIRKNNKYTTLKDVARLANTSIATVSYILNDSKGRYVSNELRERVLKAAKELNYVKCALASGLRGKQRGIIAVTVPQFTNIFFSRIILAIEQVAKEHGYILTICNTFDDTLREKEILEIMIGQRVDGFLLIPTEKGFENYEAVRRMELPYVIVERPLTEDYHYDFVAVDNYHAGYIATRHLIENGHRHIGYVCWNTVVDNIKDRRRAYKAALADAQIEYRPEYISGGNFSSDEGYRLTAELLDAQPQITAIVYEQHVQAQGGVTYLHANKIRIPDDLSMVVIGNPDWIKSNNPPITAVALPDKEVGTMSAKILFDKIFNKGTYPSAIQKKIQCRLAEGSSVQKI